MQKILSSMVLRDYRQYDPQQLQLFRRSASVSKQKNKYENNEKIGQTKQSEHNQGIAENIQTTQFNEQRIQVQPIGDVISIIESKIHTMILGENIYSQKKFQQTKIHPTSPPLRLKQDIPSEQTNENPQNQLFASSKPKQRQRQKQKQKQKQEQDNSPSLLKKYRQKIQQRKKHKTHANCFKLKQFKDKLNYTMYRHVNN